MVLITFYSVQLETSGLPFFQFFHSFCWMLVLTNSSILLLTCRLLCSHMFVRDLLAQLLWPACLQVVVEALWLWGPTMPLRRRSLLPAVVTMWRHNIPHVAALLYEMFLLRHQCNNMYVPQRNLDYPVRLSWGFLYCQNGQYNIAHSAMFKVWDKWAIFLANMF